MYGHAMSDTMSDPPGPNDWLNFYQQNFPAQVLQTSSSEATTVTTTVSTTTTLGTTTSQLSPEGRVSKPIRRRSRASRRTPTTLLNTDTTNFRAMVQQFTGGPAGASFAPTASSISSASPFSNMGFGLGPRPVHVNPNGLILAPSSGFHHLEQPNPYQQQNQHFMYSAGNREGGDNTIIQNQRLINPTTLPNVTDHSGIYMDPGHGGRFFPSTSS